MKIGFLGTGLMGQPMVKRLLSAGIPVMAYNRTPSKLESLQVAGAKITTNPDEVINACHCLILMLTNADAIREVLFSSQCSLNHRTIIQMGTISPSESRDLCQEVMARGGEYLEAPVLGSIPEVEKGQLLVMVGATEEQVFKWSSILAHFGENPLLIGPVGTASAVKLALNQLIASLTASFSLSLGFLLRQGVDIERFMTILRQSSLYASTFDKKLNRMCDPQSGATQRNFSNPNFPSKHLLKDINLFLKEGEEMGLMVIPLEGVRQVVEKAIELGFAEDDYSALYAAINPENGIIS